MLVARNRRLLALEWLNLLEDFLELMVVDILAPSVLVVVVAALHEGAVRHDVVAIFDVAEAEAEWLLGLPLVLDGAVVVIGLAPLVAFFALEVVGVVLGFADCVPAAQVEAWHLARAAHAFSVLDVGSQLVEGGPVIRILEEGQFRVGGGVGAACVPCHPDLVAEEVRRRLRRLALVAEVLLADEHVGQVDVVDGLHDLRVDSRSRSIAVTDNLRIVAIFKRVDRLQIEKIVDNPVLLSFPIQLHLDRRQVLLLEHDDLVLLRGQYLAAVRVLRRSFVLAGFYLYAK